MSKCLHIFAPLLCVLALSACGSNPEDTGSGDKVSAQVSTEPARKGSLPDIVSAYGTAMPALDASTTLSVQAAGQVAHFDVAAGALVKRGQPLLRFALAPAAVAAYQQAREAWQVARTQRDNTAQLLARQLATRDQLAQADKAMRDARSTLDALGQQQGEGSTMTLSAPFDGIVSAVTAVQGDALQPGAPLLSLGRADGIVVHVGVEPDPAHPVVPGDPVTLLPLGPGAPLQGVVKRVASMLDARTRLLDVEIAPTGKVVAGMAYRADITVGQWQGWLVPRDAMVGGGAAWQVFQVADGKAVKVPVTIVGESDVISVVSGALDPQRPLVVVGNTQLEDGMAVHSVAAESAQ